MNRAELIEELVARFSEAEWAALEDEAATVPVNAFNRSALIRMRHCTSRLEEELDAAGVRELDDMLSDYMATYLPERPDAQKYFVASCLSLAFVLEEPMHPVERVQAVVQERAGRVVYCCPCKVTGERNICDWCACETL